MQIHEINALLFINNKNSLKEFVWLLNLFCTSYQNYEDELPEWMVFPESTFGFQRDWSYSDLGRDPGGLFDVKNRIQSGKKYMEIS